MLADEQPSTSAAIAGSDLDAVLQHHTRLQEKQAEEFLQLTRSLKENISVAGHIVREDNKVQSEYTPLFLLCAELLLLSTVSDPRPSAASRRPESDTARARVATPREARVRLVRLLDMDILARCLLVLRDDGALHAHLSEDELCGALNCVMN